MASFGQPWEALGRPTHAIDSQWAESHPNCPSSSARGAPGRHAANFTMAPQAPPMLGSTFPCEARERPGAQCGQTAHDVLTCMREAEKRLTCLPPSLQFAFLTMGGAVFRTSDDVQRALARSGPGSRRLGDAVLHGWRSIGLGQAHACGVHEPFWHLVTTVADNARGGACWSGPPALSPGPVARRSAALLWIVHDM